MGFFKIYLVFVMNIWIICIVLIVLVALSRLLSEKLYSSSESKTSSPNKQTEANSNQTLPRQSDLNEYDDETIAVITAAAMSAFQGKQIVIRQISFITSRDESWARIGRLSNMSSHNIKIH